MRFEERAWPPVRGGQRTTGGDVQHMVDVRPMPQNHLEWAEEWEREGSRSMQAVVDGTTTNEHLDLEHVKRCYRAVWYHLSRAKGYGYWDPVKGGLLTAEQLEALRKQEAADRKARGL